MGFTKRGLIHFYIIFTVCSLVSCTNFNNPVENQTVINFGLNGPTEVKVASCSEGISLINESTESATFKLSSSSKDTLFYTDSSCVTTPITSIEVAGGSTQTLTIRNLSAEDITISGEIQSEDIVTNSSNTLSIRAESREMKLYDIDDNLTQQLRMDVFPKVRFNQNQTHGVCLWTGVSNYSTKEEVIYSWIKSDYTWDQTDTISNEPNEEVTSSDAVDFDVRIANDGGTLIVWSYQLSETSYGLYYRYYDPSNYNWTSDVGEEIVNESTPSNASNPKIATDNKYFYLIYKQEDRLKVTRFDPSTKTWEDSITLDTITDTDATQVRKATIKTNANGDVFVAWSQKSTTDATGEGVFVVQYNSDIEWNSSDVDATWKDRTMMSSSNSGSSTLFYSPGRLRLKFKQNQNGFLAWIQEDENDIYNIWASRYDSDSNSWDPPKKIEMSDETAEYFDANENDGEGKDVPAFVTLSINSTDESMAAYILREDDGPYKIYVNSYDNETGNWSSQPTLIKESDSNDHILAYSLIRSDDIGNRMLTWIEMTDSNYYAYYAYYIKDLGWGQPQMITTEYETTVLPDPYLLKNGDGIGNIKLINKMGHDTEEESVINKLVFE